MHIVASLLVFFLIHNMVKKVEEESLYHGFEKTCEMNADAKRNVAIHEHRILLEKQGSM